MISMPETGFTDATTFPAWSAVTVPSAQPANTSSRDSSTAIPREPLQPFANDLPTARD